MLAVSGRGFRLPVLLALSDNGPQMISDATAVFMAGARIAQHFGRPSTPNDQAWVESFFGHLKGENPHLEKIRDPGELERELIHCRTHYNTVRLHEGIGYVTPDDEHHGRGTAIRAACRPDRPPPESNGLPSTASYQRIINDSPPVVGYDNAELADVVRYTSRPAPYSGARAIWCSEWVPTLTFREGWTMPYAVRALDASTWDVFAELVERNNGIFGGCWCIGYHPECGQKGISHRFVKEERVRTGRAHAALVLDEEGLAQGWCQYGSPEELPNIKHKREYDKDAPPRPDWRITCSYVDKKHRGQGIARAALDGALDHIAQLGGGLVEAVSEVTTGREAPGRFLFSATVELFERYGFTRGRQVGKHAWIVSATIKPR